MGRSPTPRSAPVEGAGWLPQIPAQRTGEIPLLFIFNVNYDEGTSINKAVGVVVKPIPLSPRVKRDYYSLSCQTGNGGRCNASNYIPPC